jgi:hypothetical protein
MCLLDLAIRNFSNSVIIVCSGKREVRTGKRSPVNTNVFANYLVNVLRDHE